ncbi:MAG: hypothetical protein ACU0B1_10015, partial [Thermohalobaculum sp.]
LLVALNFTSMAIGFVLYIFVPRPEIIYFNLLFVFVTIIIGILGIESFGTFSYQDSTRNFSLSNENDITGVVLILVLACAGCAYRIERIKFKQGT